MFWIDFDDIKEKRTKKSNSLTDGLMNKQKQMWGIALKNAELQTLYYKSKT